MIARNYDRWSADNFMFNTHYDRFGKIADYIAFIQDGELLLNQSVHNVSENYALVEGGLDLLDRDTEKPFIHVQHAATGFEALTTDISAVKNIFGESIVIDEASLEDIMYYLKGRMEQA